jgi:hypothetical protein
VNYEYFPAKYTVKEVAYFSLMFIASEEELKERTEVLARIYIKDIFIMPFLYIQPF